MKKTIYDKQGVFRNAILEVDETGTIWEPGFNGDILGRVTADGKVYKGRGLNETYVGRIDENGNIYDGSWFGGSYVGSIDDGVLRDRHGFGSSDISMIRDNKDGSDRKTSGNGRGYSGTGGGDISDPLAVILGIIGIGIIYVLYKVLKGAIYYLNAMSWMFTDTKAVLITAAVVIIPLMIYFLTDVVCVSAYNNSHPDRGFVKYWIDNVNTPLTKKRLFPYIGGYIAIVWVVVSLIAIGQYNPPMENQDIDSMTSAEIEREVYSTDEIKEYEKYMKKLDDTSWHSDQMSFYFSYNPDSEDRGYVIDGDVMINREPYKYCYEIGSNNSDDGYGYGYAVYKNSLDDEDAFYLFYDEYTDMLTDYDELYLSREYANVVDEIKWGLIKWSRGGIQYSFLPYFMEYSPLAKALYIAMIIIIIAIIALPISLLMKSRSAQRHAHSA